MRSIFVLVLIGALFTFAVGCEKKAVSPPPPPPTVTDRFSRVVLASGTTTAPFIAERHKIVLLTSGSQLQKSWESALHYCGTIQCEVLTSSLTTGAGGAQPTGSISMRVAPGDFSRLMEELRKLGKVSQHTTERTDVTTQVVDTEARIKNQTTFRDNLRTMLSKPSATVKDLVEIQKQLTDTQAELDSETAQRKILANETEKIAVDASFYVESSSGGSFSSIKQALSDAGSDLGDSTGALITFIVMIVPWFILIVPGIWLIVRFWRRWRRNRALRRQETSAQI